jgi:hypothetical protein
MHIHTNNNTLYTTHYLSYIYTIYIDLLKSNIHIHIHTNTLYTCTIYTPLLYTLQAS